MNIIPRRWKVRALGLALLTVLYACTVTPGGYVGGVYEPSGSDYGGWGPGYHVGPSRHGQRRPEHLSPRAYRPAPPSRPAPPIPTRPRRR
jgi:hypothetical protein